jgi:hypothetical protein
MLREFENLTPAEQQQMFDAIPLIVILVAGADDNIDEVELAEAQRLADIRSFNNRGQIIAYYEKIEIDLTVRIQVMLKELPNALEPRQNEVVARLSTLNDILAKMKLPFGYPYYKSFLSFSKHLAEFHGGFMRFMTVGPEEAEVVGLPMLVPVVRPSEVDFPDLGT